MHEIDDQSNIQSAEKVQPDDGLRQPKPSTTGEIVGRGQEALLRLYEENLDLQIGIRRNLEEIDLCVTRVR
jgi:hypothetical protein